MNPLFFVLGCLSGIIVFIFFAIWPRPINWGDDLSGGHYIGFDFLFILISIRWEKRYFRCRTTMVLSFFNKRYSFLIKK